MLRESAVAWGYDYWNWTTIMHREDAGQSWLLGYCRFRIAVFGALLFQMAGVPRLTFLEFVEVLHLAIEISHVIETS